MNAPWEKAYVYGRTWWYSKIAHVVALNQWARETALCGADTIWQNHIPDPYPVCKNCLRTKRAKELGMLDGTPWLGPIPRFEELI